MKKRILVVVLAVMVVCSCLLPAYASEPTESFRLVLVPNGPVSDKVNAEVRVGVYNSGSTGTFTVDISYSQNGTTQTLGPITQQVAGNETGLFRAYINTSGLSGAYEVKAVVKKSGTQVGMLTEQLTVVPTSSANKSLPLVTTMFMDPGAFVEDVYSTERAATQQDVRDKMDTLHTAGVDTIIITYAEYILNGWGAFYPSEISELTDEVVLAGNSVATQLEQPFTFDFLGTVLDRAATNGQKVFIGIGRGKDSWITFDTRSWLRPESQSALNAQYLQTQVNFSKSVIDELYELYGDEDAFYGWYITNECQDIAWANAYYNPIADYMHSLAPEKPVLVSPAAVTPWLIVNQMRTAIASSSADIFAYQDSVGAGYDETTFTYTYNPQTRINQLEAMYGKYLVEHTNASSPKHFWANIESWEMAGPNYTNAYAADFSRFEDQIEIAAKYVESISSYEAGGFFESPDSTLKLGGQPAIDLFSDYIAYLLIYRAALTQ